MKLGRKKEESRTGIDKMASLLATLLHSVQNRWASCLARWTAPLPKGMLQIGLILFCIVFGGASFFSLLGALERDQKPLGKPATLTVPKYYKHPGIVLTPLLTPQDREYISRFKTHLDSLNSSMGGRAVYDSLLRERPGLLDSLRLIEDVFYSPSK